MRSHEPIRLNGTPNPVLIVTGLAAEARIAAGPGVLAVSAPPAALAAKLDAVGENVSAVISFGLCGGLAPGLRAGTLVVADAVESGGRYWRCATSVTRGWRERLAAERLPFAEGSIAGRDAPIMTVAGKAALRQSSGCLAVDTESHIAAAFAAARGLPFVAIRAVCDAAHRDLPPLANRAVKPDGKLDWTAIGRELGSRPGQILALPGTALATATAMRTLSRVRRRLGARLGL